MIRAANGLSDGDIKSRWGPGPTWRRFRKGPRSFSAALSLGGALDYYLHRIPIISGTRRGGVARTWRLLASLVGRERLLMARIIRMAIAEAAIH
ncbi:hypothetical protein CEXT_571691 [Caerostris extrusa]|uniref:Uncharacterized protein n=1 Tax=Caerostris extrusa TaxID=172846 RepID=A0AAV4PNR7_CAEEX|nr:hypothetical protein CEXT_571691 [Caerostris extrusa]